MRPLGKLTEFVLNLAGRIILPLAERIRQRRERHRIDERLRHLPIEELANAARDDLEERRRRSGYRSE